MLLTKLPKKTSKEIISLKNVDIVRIDGEYYSKWDFEEIEWISAYSLLKELCNYRDTPESEFPIREIDIDQLKKELGCYKFDRQVLRYILTIIRKYELAERKRVKEELIHNMFNTKSG